MINSLTQDTRKIASIHTGQEAIFASLDVDKIEPYWENNGMWFAIYRGDSIVRRVNGNFVESVKYEEDGEAYR